ncbi:Pectin lyase-like superfamily protein [Striga hermonthica]|uniref:Pectin lyase-like superfamily protein n=1 Tax=Striga hermonthica TaxID=68872 RepID=A0A9N7MXE7_STRHE|nr:Pectin lyase-like superfamily protein [Striga hermonthica]
MVQLFLVVTSFILIHYHSSYATHDLSYNVLSFGAKSNGKSDCTKAFQKAWAAACAATQPATIYVPSGRYSLKNVVFTGNLCKNPAITIRIDGTLVAPNAIGNADTWLKFYKVTGVSIYGGTLDGRGSKLWACKKSGKSCPNGATSLAFYHSTNIIINGLSSLNSKMFHILIYGCLNMNVVNTRISAPGNSPNTDGIHITKSSSVTISNSRIGTGDDCISIGPGASNLWIENLSCGPGHGISIGSLGWDLQEEGVQNVTVKTATFTGTQNGVRVKTWARPSNAYVRDVLFQHVVIVNALNPIIIDQNYCPTHKNCPHQGSGVQISGITYQDIHGTSASQVAVKFDCSKKKPCSGINLNEVSLTYNNQPAIASCANARGMASGVDKPASCF